MGSPYLHVGTGPAPGDSSFSLCVWRLGHLKWQSPAQGTATSHGAGGLPTGVPSRLVGPALTPSKAPCDSQDHPCTDSLVAASLS